MDQGQCMENVQPVEKKPEQHPQMVSLGTWSQGDLAHSLQREKSSKCLVTLKYCIPLVPQVREGSLHIHTSWPQPDGPKEDHVVVMKQLILLSGGPCDNHHWQDPVLTIACLILTTTYLDITFPLSSSSLSFHLGWFKARTTEGDNTYLQWELFGEVTDSKPVKQFGQLYTSRIPHLQKYPALQDQGIPTMSAFTVCLHWYGFDRTCVSINITLAFNC